MIRAPAFALCWPVVVDDALGCIMLPHPACSVCAYSGQASLAHLACMHSMMLHYSKSKT